MHMTMTFILLHKYRAWRFGVDVKVYLQHSRKIYTLWVSRTLNVFMNGKVDAGGSQESHANAGELEHVLVVVVEGGLVRGG